MFARIPQWLLKSLQKVFIIIMYAPWCGIIRTAGCLAQGLVWATEHCVRWGSGSHPREEASRRGVGFPIVKYRQFHEAVAGWTVNLSGFIQICLDLSHVVHGGVDRSHTAMQCTKYTGWTLCYEVVRLSVRLSVTLMCCAQTTERIKLLFRVRVTTSFRLVRFVLAAQPYFQYPSSVTSVFTLTPMSPW